MREIAPLTKLRSLIVGTAGHIDHGKTRLVQALTGVDTDRLPEEKRRGITVDLGFAATEMQGPDGEPLLLSFVDVPGHHGFIRNMVAGATGMDCVLLVISAEDGVMPQTEEHLAICGFLGISRGLTVLTKADLVPQEQLQKVRTDVSGFLRGSFLDNAPIVCVSALTGQGIPMLKRELVSLALQPLQRAEDAMPRLPIDRVFTMKGFGTVVTGTLQAGTLERGQALVLQPDAIPVRIRGLQMHGRNREQAAAGSRVALNLSRIEPSRIQRGFTLVPPGSITAVDIIDASVTLLENAPELRHRDHLRIHCFTAETVAAVSLYEYRPVRANETRLLRLRLARPIVLLPGDRFVLRRLSPAQTIGGGLVLDAHPLHGKRKKKVAQWLQTVQSASDEQQLLLRIARYGEWGCSAQTLGREMGWTAETVLAKFAPVIASGRVVEIAGGVLLAREALVSAAGRVLALVERAETAHSGALRSSELVSQSRLSAAVLSAVLAQLTRDRKVQVGDAQQVTLFSAEPKLAPTESKQVAAIAAAYERAGLDPPLPAEVIRSLGVGEKEVRRAITLLLRSGDLVKISGNDIFMHRGALDQLCRRVQTLRGRTLTVSGFKELTGLSRKYAIPLLEYLDRERITQRQGDHRLVV